VLAAAPHILVSEWIDGRPLSDIIANGTTAERDHAGLLYERFLLTGPSRAGLLHADPHPGNFRITPENKLCVFDFGAVSRLPDGLPVAMGHAVAHCPKRNAEDVLEGLRLEGFVKPNIESTPTKF